MRLDAVGGFANMGSRVADNVPVSSQREAVRGALEEGHDVIEPSRYPQRQNSAYQFPHMTVLSTVPFTTYSLILYSYPRDLYIYSVFSRFR
jgi:hypothetical protein